MSAIPPFGITPVILTRSNEIAHELGLLEGAQFRASPVSLRKDNQIKTIQSTLAIEGNSLSLEQVSDVIEGKRVLGAEREIIEVKNALLVYSQLGQFDPLSISSFKKAHNTLMNDLTPENGKFRSKGVGIFKGNEVTHVAPPAKRVPGLIDNLFHFLNSSENIPWLIKACVFHYEMEFIHPFSDGNGRMGRLWQQLLLIKENPLFEFISVESLIKENQRDYYHVLSQCDEAADSTAFIEFSLKQILDALARYSESIVSKVIDTESRLEFARSKFINTWFSRKDYIMLHKNISTATASRDLLKGLELGFVKKQGERNQVRYQFI